MLRTILRRFAIVVVIGLLAVMLVQSVAAEKFEIILLLKPEKKYNGPATLALVAGGYSDGLEKDLRGSLTLTTLTDIMSGVDSKRLEVEVQDVTEFVSSCLIRGEIRENIRSGTSVGFDLPNFDAQELRRRADKALADEDYRRSLHYLTTLTQVYGLVMDSTVEQLIELCRQVIDEEANRKLSRKEKRALKKQADQFHALGTYFFNHDNYDAARQYFERAVRADKKQEHAKYLLSLIEDGVPLDIRPDEEIEDLEVYPEMVHQGTPEYPRLARQRGITGVAWARVLVDESGSVVKAAIAKSSGSMLLDQAVLKNAYSCRFKPGIKNGEPIACWVTYKVDFRLGP